MARISAILFMKVMTCCVSSGELFLLWTERSMGCSPPGLPVNTLHLICWSLVHACEQRPVSAGA